MLSDLFVLGEKKVSAANYSKPATMLDTHATKTLDILEMSGAQTRAKRWVLPRLERGASRKCA
jgi:hypothetical protein